MIQQVKALAAVAKDLGSVLSTQMADRNPRRLNTSSDL